MPSFEQIRVYARCWSEARLREAAKLWPEPLTWAWFLGERCAQKSRAEAVEILSVAVAYMKQKRVPLPIGSVGRIWIAGRKAELPLLLAAMAALGEYLDRFDANEPERPDLSSSEPGIALELALAALFGELPQPAIIEAKPSDAGGDEDEDTGEI